jgi:acyl-CoA synthetase (AMP-forming)/AMP-acid ligase II
VSRSARDALRAAWRAQGWYPDLTVGGALTAGAASRPDDQLLFAAVDGDIDAVTLRTHYARACDLAGRLATAGVGPGDTVVVQAAADRASTEALVALWLLGVVVVPLVATTSMDELAHVVGETGARAVVVAPEWRGVALADRVIAARSDLGLDAVFVLGELDSLRSGSVPAVPASPDSVAVVLYTSGSTGVPKGVQHSHETLLSGLTAVPADGSSRSLASFPAGHVASLLSLLRPLSVGGTTVVLDRWSARAAATLVEEHRLTTSAGTPFFLLTLLDEAERSGRDISSLQWFLVGAATVPPSLVARAQAAGITSWRTYGSTEHPAISAGSPLDPPEKRRLTDGRPGAGNEVRLLDERGQDVASGEEGEIVARGPKQFLGYRDASLDADAFTDSTWFRTGDLGRFDPDGYLVVTDRVKDIIIRGGENISAREIEDALADHVAVSEVAIRAVPDDVWGEAVAAYVIAKAGFKPTLDELRAHVEAHGLAAHKAPARLVIVDDFPRTASGKVRKRDLPEPT